MNVNRKVNTFVSTYINSLLFTGIINKYNEEKIVTLISKLYFAFTHDAHVAVCRIRVIFSGSGLGNSNSSGSGSPDPTNSGSGSGKSRSGKSGSGFEEKCLFLQL